MTLFPFILILYVSFSAYGLRWYQIECQRLQKIIDDTVAFRLQQMEHDPSSVRTPVSATKTIPCPPPSFGGIRTAATNVEVVRIGR